MYIFEMYINQFDVHHTLQHATTIDVCISKNDPSPPVMLPQTLSIQEFSFVPHDSNS